MGKKRAKGNQAHSKAYIEARDALTSAILDNGEVEMSSSSQVSIAKSIVPHNDLVRSLASNIISRASSMIAKEEFQDTLYSKICDEIVKIAKTKDIEKYYTTFAYIPQGGYGAVYAHKSIMSLDDLSMLLSKEGYCNHYMLLERIACSEDEYYGCPSLDTMHIALELAFDMICTSNLDDYGLTKKEILLKAKQLAGTSSRTASELYYSLHTILYKIVRDSSLNSSVRDAIAENPLYSGIIAKAVEIAKEIETLAPSDLCSSFPLARSIHRHFIIHIGPTNSGKTYNAIEDMMSAESGVYLGPLRLLAYEQFQKLNNNKVKCSLLTGEEKAYIPGAQHMSSTVDTANFSNEYEVAVIDEAQMIADQDRGDRWANAIAGICAKRVHVCTAPDAKDIIIDLIDRCGDSYEIQEHSRMTPLEFDPKPYAISSSVRKGDALVVFSRKSVHSLASELSRMGWKISMVYGAMPHDVRHSEAERFAKGETDVLVATDAIGMGMNLPIKRVVFIEQMKFDGHSKRPLSQQEVKQIAGRAGRYGIYDKGQYASTKSQHLIKSTYEADCSRVFSIPLSFPKKLLEVNGLLSDTMKMWSSMEPSPPFVKLPVDRDVDLARCLEEAIGEEAESEEWKSLIYQLITIAFNEQNPELYQIWHSISLAKLNGNDVVPIPYGKLPRNLKALEEQYAICDLLFQFCVKFNKKRKCELLDKRRMDISKKIIEILQRKAFEERKCERCGRELPWNWPYPTCDICHFQEQW